MSSKKYFEFICLGCNQSFKRRTDHAHQSHYCRPCRGKKTLEKHGMSRTRLYKVWQMMRQRCGNSLDAGYARYGAKRIFVCKEWDAFENFMAWALNNGYSENLSIDRINNKLGYNPSNCRWATPIEQAQNRTNGLNWKAVKEIRQLYKDHTYAQIANIYQVHPQTIFLVCKNKIWKDETFTPLRRHRWNKIQNHTHRR